MFINANFFVETPCEADGAIKPCREFEPKLALKGSQILMEIEGKMKKVKPQEFLENEELGYGLNKLDFFSESFLSNLIKENCICFSRVGFVSELSGKTGYILEAVVDTTFSPEIEEEYNKEIQTRSNLYFA